MPPILDTAQFTFDPALHAYYNAQGVLVPSVTQVLKDNGFINFDGVPAHVLERKRHIGVLVHQATEFYDNGEDMEQLDIPEIIKPFCEGWVNFCEDMDFEPELVEHRMLAEHRGMFYGMTLDVEGWIGDDYYILEKKCAATESPVWGLQTAAYDLGRNGKPTAKRAAVQLGPRFPRRYKLFPYADPSDYQIWGAALALTAWKQNKGLFTLENIPEREAA